MTKYTMNKNKQQKSIVLNDMIGHGNSCSKLKALIKKIY